MSKSTKKPSTAWMHTIARQKRDKNKNELQHLALVTAKWIQVGQKAFNELFPRDLEATFEELHSRCKHLNYTQEDFNYVRIMALHVVYGDPFIMEKSTRHLGHSTPYWNPTANKLNICALGLVDYMEPKTGDITTKDYINPGEYIMIPTQYIVGGKHSVINGIAPQLRPIHKEIDNILEIAPITYTEWCNYSYSPLSKCCNRQAVWSTLSNLICIRCGKPIDGTSFCTKRLK